MPNNKTLIRYIMEAGNKFNEIINDSISKASEGLSHKIDAYLLSDLKRMSNLGVLEIHQEQPEIMPFDENKNSISISQKIRIYFKGEETIKELKKEIEELKAENDRLKCKHNISNVVRASDGFLKCNKCGEHPLIIK